MPPPSLRSTYSILTYWVYSYFESSCGTEPVSKCPKKQWPLHNNSLKELTRKAKQELHPARQQGFPAEVIQSLSRQFFTLVRSHSKLEKTANGRSVFSNVRQATEVLRHVTPEGFHAFHPWVYWARSILSETQSKHKALAVCWLDIANAYGSVHHSLIQFSLQHYHAPPQFLSILHALYSGLEATVITESLETPLVSL